MLIGFFPSPDSVDLQNILALVIDPDALRRNGSTEDDGHEIVLNRAFLEVRNIDTYGMSVVDFLAQWQLDEKLSNVPYVPKTLREVQTLSLPESRST
jgi:hypothetical protein